MPDTAQLLPSAPASTSQPETLPAVPTLAEALAEIRTDSQARPDQYLEDTVVPHGGE